MQHVILPAAVDFQIADGIALFAKTELGIRELRERQLNLPLPLRSLLIMIDGQRTVADVLAKTRALGLDARAIQQLAGDGLIARKYATRTDASRLVRRTALAANADTINRSLRGILIYMLRQRR